VAGEHSYQVYFLGASDHIREARTIDAPDQISAKAAAKVLLSHSEYTSVEVYEDWRLVLRHERQQQAT
jgi:hypothetical protein